MRYLRFLPFFILSSLIVNAAEEMGHTYENSFTTISEKEFEEWSFQQAVQALGTPPGPVLESTYKMLRSSWNMKSYYKRNGRQHYLLNDITRKHTTTDMNTYMLVRADSVWMDHSCKFDSLALEEHMLKPYEEKEPRELEHQQKWLGMLAFRDDREWDYLLGITEGQRGIPPMLTQRRFTLSDGKEQRASEVNRLWTDPVLHAPYIMQRGSDFARLTLRCMLHDTSVLYDKAQLSGLTCWNYTWGKDLPEPLVLGMQLMQGRATGKLPAEADLQKIRDAAAGLSHEMKSFTVRSMLAADPTCMPWKKLDDPTAGLGEMPDCSAVYTAQWSNELLGAGGNTVEEDVALFDKVVQKEKAQDMLSSLVLYSLAEGSRVRRDSNFNVSIPRQGHFRFFSNFDVMASENGVDVLIDEHGTRFARHDDALRARYLQLNAALLRCALQLAMLERDGKTEALDKGAAALADLLNREHLWPLLLNLHISHQITPRCQARLMHHCRADLSIIESMDSLFSGGSNAPNLFWAKRVTTRKDEDGDPDPEPELVASILLAHQINNRCMLASDEEWKAMQRTYMDLEAKLPGKGCAEALLRVGRMSDALYQPDLQAKFITGANSRRGYYMVMHALRKGDLPTAEKILERMTSTPRNYKYPSTRMAMALVARAKGDEATAREQERLGITQAAMLLNSYYSYYWNDAHQLLLEHGLSRESERLMLLQPKRNLSYIRPELQRIMAEQRRFRGAAFWAEYNLAYYASAAAHMAGKGSQHDLVKWRLQADVYHALSLLQQGKNAQAEALLTPAMKQLERMPIAAASLAHALLQCADIPQETRRSYRERLLAGAAGNPTAHALIQAVELKDLPTVDESAEQKILESLAADSSVHRPFSSPLYTWHLQKTDQVPDDVEETDERTSSSATISARILSAGYEKAGQSPWVELLTEKGRKLRVKLEEMAADDIANIIEWKETNGICTWTVHRGIPVEIFDGRLDKIAVEKCSGTHKINGRDVSDGRIAEFTRTDGSYAKCYVNLLDGENREQAENCPQVEERTMVLHTTLAAAQAAAEFRKVPIEIFMLGRRGGVEEQNFRKMIENKSGSWNQNSALLVCYQDADGNWEEPGREVMNLLRAACPEAMDAPDAAPEDRALVSGFRVTISPNRHELPAVQPFMFTPNLLQDPDYKKAEQVIRRGKVEELAQILKNRPELVKSRSHYSPANLLHTALLSRRNEMVKVLLEHGASVNACAPDGTPLLYFCIGSGNEELVRLFVQHGAKINKACRSRSGHPVYPIQHALRKPEMLKLLIELGADANMRLEGGRTLLLSMVDSAPWLDQKGIEAVMRAAEVLVPAGLDISARDARGNSVLFYVACMTSRCASSPPHREPLLQALRRLVELGADTEETAGGTPSLMDRLWGKYCKDVPAMLPDVEKIIRKNEK